MNKLFFLFALCSSVVFAAGNGAHHGSAADLIAPAVNFFILVGFLGFKLKNPIKQHFNEKSDTVEQTMKRASQRSAEAKAKLEEQNKKLKNVDSEMSNIQQRAKDEFVSFKNRYINETNQRIDKIKIDAKAKIEADKNNLVASLNRELINKVISGAKDKIKTNSSLQGKVAGNLLKELK